MLHGNISALIPLNGNFFSFFEDTEMTTPTEQFAAAGWGSIDP